MSNEAVKPTLAIISLVFAAVLVWTTPVQEDRTPQAAVPEPLRAAVVDLWEHLTPHIERSVAKGHDGLLINVGYEAKLYNWTKPLRTLVDYGICRGHPEAIKALYSLDTTFTIPVLSNADRLFLEWRALHAGLRLGFLDKVRPIASLPPVTLASGDHEQSTIQQVDVRTSRQVFGEDEAWLVEVSDHLRSKRFKPAMRKIDRLGWMCLGYRKPDQEPLKFPEDIRFDPVNVRHPAG